MTYAQPGDVSPEDMAEIMNAEGIKLFTFGGIN
jgi:hypothetical protein